MRLGVLIAAGLLIAAPTAFAQTSGQIGEQKQEQVKDEEQKKSYMYEWTDDKGVVHITDGLDKVPRQYRSSARRLESSAGEETEATGEGRQKISAPPGSRDAEERELDRKEEWQQRIKTAQRQLAALEQRYNDLGRQRTELLGKWGGVASGHLEDKAEADRLDREMQQVQKNIDDVRNQIEVVIPDEARKAGVPPGWLRE